jgi:hypothetical protein
MRILAALSLLALVAGCSSQPTPSPSPAPRPVTTPVVVAPQPPRPATGGDWQDALATPGDWVYRKDERGSVALFGGAGQDALFVMRCDKAAAKLYLSRAGSKGSDPIGAMTIRTTTGLKSFRADDTGGTPPYVATALPPSDPHLDAMAFSRGKFLVAMKGMVDLVIPSWAEVTRVVEDCRA